MTVKEGEGKVKEKYSTCEGRMKERKLGTLLFYYMIMIDLFIVKEESVLTVHIKIQ